MTPPTAVPVSIRRDGDEIEIVWSSDHVGRYPMRMLRLACPCARCVDEMTNRPLLDPRTVPLDVRADTITPVGAYGVRIGWSGGHAAGIYTYGMLLALCPCPVCTAAR